MDKDDIILVFMPLWFTLACVIGFFIVEALRSAA